ncbi:TetR/AcrR family transcriptional regulator [Planotetraspora sp. A-T 1434]|uniref:TetR/AcrR family transcriptional regulator n=1 Tax=Planotetraspora sp. A-T 1434 TaxID=2979219 RepID=UPI0021C14841|nr:TetR/AcrR family transcriptional regulator [Planotetraspora sp. A-T 1434]MCT9933768.1 TetR/AcrR family transcriptional regulator [Planotetraspora sp. A-T 1434]
MSDAREQREQIIAAALGIFGRYGYRRTSMDLIAQATRMSTAHLPSEAARDDRAVVVPGVRRRR